MERILFAAAAQGNTRAINQCIDKGANVNAVTLRQITPVFCAAQHGCVKAIELLFNRGADINLRDIDGWTPLMYASQHGHELATLTLIASGANTLITSTNCASALILAVQQKHVNIAKHIVAAMKTGYGKEDIFETLCNAFIWSIAIHEIEIFHLLLEAGASANVGYKFSDSDNGTALILACRLGHNDMIVKLIEAGADVRHAPFGKTPMEEAMPKAKALLQRALKSQIKDT
jgi:ankyrin repeat protein